MILQDVITAVVAVLIVVGLFGLAMWGWRRRSASQSGMFDELPGFPDDPGTPGLPPLDGVYIGSTYAGYWQERVAREPLGFRSAATLAVYEAGIGLDLTQARVWIPRSDLVGVRRESKLAGKVVPGAGLLVVRWRVAGPDGHTFIDSGFRADDKDDYPRWAEVAGEVSDPGEDIQQDIEENK